MVKTIIPELTTHFDDDMIVMEKWIPKKPISAIYFDGEKERYYVKRFLIENEAKEESFISDHPNSQLEIVSTDWRPLAEVEFTKERGKDRKENMQVNFEEFISIKGISALGNQLTKDKINQVSLMEPLPYEAPEEIPAEEIEVIDETEVLDKNNIEKSSKPSNIDDDEPKGTLDDKGQITLF
jgi:topoisomerase-4 subunit A